MPRRFPNSIRANRRASGNPPSRLASASVADVIYSLLLYFFVFCVMRAEGPLVINRIPAVMALQKLEMRPPKAVIYMGPANEPYSEGHSIQLNDVLAPASAVPAFIRQTKRHIAEVDQHRLVVILKVYRKAPMGIVSDVKHYLRESNTFKVMYAALPGR